MAESKWIGEESSPLSVLRFLKAAYHSDVVVLNVDTRRLFLLCLIKWLCPAFKVPLVSVDIHLSQPIGYLSKLSAWVKRILLKKVDRFILYFRDFGGYSRYFGISPDRVSYIPFKVNQWESLPAKGSLSSDGTYILTAGRGLRDLPTFLMAMKEVPYPAILLYQDINLMRTYGTELDVENLPPNVKMVLHDGNPDSWINYISGAKVIVIPALESIRPVGISLYLLAMALLKAIVITDGPATRGLLKNEALVVPGRNSKALSVAIRSIWEDDVLRSEVASAGRRYAEQLGGEQRLLADIVDACGDIVHHLRR